MQETNTNRLRELREARDLQLYDLAPIVRRSPAQVSRYETGESNPPIHIVRKLAAHYEVSVEHLMGWDLEPEGKAA